MPYGSLQGLIDRFGADEIRQLTDRSLPSAGEIVVDVVDRALADADAVVDRYLGSVYPLPLAQPLPADLVRVASDIARYFLYDQAAPPTIRQHYEDAIAWLRDISLGRVLLVGADGVVIGKSPASVGSGAVAQYAADATFGDRFERVWSR